MAMQRITTRTQLVPLDDREARLF